jgi:hypothetical protein
MADVNYGLLQPLKDIKAPDFNEANQKMANTSYLKQLEAASKSQEERAQAESPLKMATMEADLAAKQQESALNAEFGRAGKEADINYKNSLIRSQEFEQNIKKIEQIRDVAAAVTFAPADKKNEAWQAAREFAEKQGQDISAWPKLYDEKAGTMAQQAMIQAAGAGKLMVEQEKARAAKEAAEIKARGTAGSAGAPKGYKWKNDDPNSGELEPIPGGPAAKMTPQNAAARANLESTLPGWEKAKETLLPGGKINREAIWTGAGTLISDQGIPFTKGREAYQNAERVLFAKLRLESGAAVPDTEREAYRKLYLPNRGDSDSAIKQKLENLDGFVNNTKTNIKGLTKDEVKQVLGTAFLPDPNTIYDNGKGITGSEVQLVEKIKKDNPPGYIVTQKDVDELKNKYGLKKKTLK